MKGGNRGLTVWLGLSWPAPSPSGWMPGTQPNHRGSSLGGIPGVFLEGTLELF